MYYSVLYSVKVSQLRKDLQNASEENQELLKTNSEEIDRQRAKYEDQIAKLKFDHSGEIEILYLENEKRLKGLAEKYDLDLKVMKLLTLLFTSTDLVYPNQFEGKQLKSL